MYGKSEQERYESVTTRLQEFVGDDDEHGHQVPPRRRARFAGRAVNGAEGGLSRLDPLLTEIRLRYAQALDAAGSRPGRLRDHLGYVIREASVARGPDDDAVNRLRAIQSTERLIGGPRALRKTERARLQAERSRDTGGLAYVFAAQDLADRYRMAGRHRRFVEAIDELERERGRLGLDEDQQIVFAQTVGMALLEAGEVQRALAPLEKARKQTRGDRIANASAAWEIAFLDFTTAQCQLANGKARAAEAVLREALALIERSEGRQGRHLAKLRHRTVFELGTALFCQDRFDEAVERFQEACDLLAGTSNPPENTFTTYRNTRVYAAMVNEAS